MIFSVAWNEMLLTTKKFLFWTFRRWEMRSFFEPKSWWKDDIYWLLKSSCFELFRDKKYSLFLSQKVDERWHLLITEKFLFWTFRWWVIRSLFQPKLWWKDDIYLAFLNFPWYSRTYGNIVLSVMYSASVRLIFLEMLACYNVRKSKILKKLWQTMNSDIHKFADLFKIKFRILGMKYSVFWEETKWLC